VPAPGDKDLRKYPRFELKINAKYRVLDTPETKKVVTRNVCAEGLCFFSDEKLKSGTRVELELDLIDKTSPVKIEGEIKWSEDVREEEKDRGRFMNGVRVLDVPKTDEGRFMRYYCDRLLQKYGPSV
jgi:hypothetical protein